MKSHRMRSVLLLVGFAIAGVCLAAGALWLHDPHALYALFDRPSDVMIVREHSSIDTRDRAVLVAWADDVFLGRVVARSGTGTVPDSVPGTSNDMPYTLYRVEVLRALKGSLSGTVEVRQDGGMSGNSLVLYENDPLLESGETCLFVTKGDYDPSVDRNDSDGDPAPGRPRLVNVYGDIRLSSQLEQAEAARVYRKAIRHAAKEAKRVRDAVRQEESQ